MTFPKRVATAWSRLPLMFHRPPRARTVKLKSPEGVFRDSLRVSPGFEQVLSRAGLETVAEVLSLTRGLVVTHSRTSRTLSLPPSSPADPGLFVKVYSFPTHRDIYRGLLRGTLIGRPRALREYRCLEKMRGAGLAAVCPVACGIRRKGPFVIASFLITAACAPDAASLTQILSALPPDVEALRRRRSSIRALAARTRLMHAAGFVHGDFFLRNIVVARDDPRQVCFLDCPNGRVSLTAGVLKGAALGDLAQLDAGASLVAGRTDRLRFFLEYAAQRRLLPAHRRAIAKVLHRERAFSDRERLRLANDAPATRHPSLQESRAAVSTRPRDDSAGNPLMR